MKKMKFSILLILSFFFFTNPIGAQDYKLAGGLRLGYPVSLSLKYFISGASALEGFLGTRGYSYLAFDYRSTVVGGAYLMHFPLEIDELPGLQWYVGGGASIYLYNYDNGILDKDRVGSSLSIQGYAGVDYSFDDTLLNISIGWPPAIVFRGIGSGLGGDFNLHCTFVPGLIKQYGGILQSLLRTRLPARQMDGQLEVDKVERRVLGE